MSNILVKNPDDLLIGRPLKLSVESFLVDRSQKRYNRPVEVYFVSLNEITLVGSATLCSILKLSCDLIRLYTVLYFLPKMSILLPSNNRFSRQPERRQYPFVGAYKSVSPGD